MKLKIVSDGIPKNTKVITEDGKAIDNIRSITWHCEAGKLATVTLGLVLVEVDLTGEHDRSEYETVDVTPVGEEYKRTILVKKDTA